MPVELTAMKNTPSKRASLLIAAWYCCRHRARAASSCSYSRVPQCQPAPTTTGGNRTATPWDRLLAVRPMPLPILAQGSSRTRPARPRRRRRRGARSAASSAASCADSNQERLFFLAERRVVSARPHAPCAQWYQPPQSFPQISSRLLCVEHYLGDS